ncbi:hypothetical protein BH23ACT10_BH23ACT10_39670 [soil metagenome]
MKICELLRGFGWADVVDRFVGWAANARRLLRIVARALDAPL